MQEARRNQIFNRAVREMHRLPPVDTFLKDRAEWMIQAAGMQEKLADKIVYKDKLAGKVAQGLEIACLGAGKAHEADEIDQLLPGSHITMVDPHDYMSAPVEKRLKNLAHDTEYLEASVDATSLAHLKDASLDAATLFFVLHHMTSEEQQKVLQEVKRVLKDDGYLFVSEDVVEGIEQKKVAERIDRTLNVEIASVSPQNYLGKENMKQLFEDAGFEIDRVTVEQPGKVQHAFFVLKKR